MKAEQPVVGMEFPAQIERIVREKRITYMDAVLHWCESHRVELGVGAELVKRSSLIRTRIAEEARALRFLK